MPLEGAVPMEFAALPESVVEDIAEFFLFLPQQATGISIDIYVCVHI